MVRTWCAVVVAVGLAGSAGAAPPQQGAEQIKARQRISMMEGVLERAVSNGADSLLRQVRAVTPDMPLLTGVPQVRGFRLEGYGVFFDVEVPGLRLPVTWPLRYMARENRDLGDLVAELRAMIAQMDAPYQDRFAQVVARLESQALGPVNARAQIGVAAAPPAKPAGAADERAADGLIEDPALGYTREVKAALVDAMIENSGPLALGPEEWLAVAARDNIPPDPLFPGDTADFSTVIFRIKGSDLAAFRGGRVTLEQARQRVEQREY